MVTQLVVSDKLGLISLEGLPQPLFLPVQMQSTAIKRGAARLIDAEVKQILTAASQRVKEVFGEPASCTRTCY